MRNQGFTLVELITIIVLLGILAIYAVPRLVTSTDTGVIAAQRTLVSMLRLQQQRAMQDTANSLEYGLHLSVIEDQFVITPVGPIETQMQDSMRFPGVELNTSNEHIRFNALGCVAKCGLSDVIVNLNGTITRSVCINRQGYISQGDCN